MPSNIITILAEVRELFQKIKFLCIVSIVSNKNAKNKIHVHPCTTAKKDATHAPLVFQFPTLSSIGDLHSIILNNNVT